MQTIEENKERFLSLCSFVKREGIDDLLKWLEQSDFFTAPASSKYHGSYEGGLLQHSLNVYENLDRIIAAHEDLNGYLEFISRERNVQETQIIVSLFHDLCKTYLYTTEKRNRKNEFGQWESYDAYTYDEAFKYGGHGSKSVYIVQNFMKLTPEEATAINCHMGAFGADAQSIGAAFEACPLAWLLSVADQEATYLDEGFLLNKTAIWSKRMKWMNGFITQ